MDWDDLSLLLTRPIAFHRMFATIGGNALSGLFLSQAFYWTNKTNDPDGWFYKTAVEWEEETAMTRYELEAARKNLKKLKVLEEEKRGLPCKLYYRVNKQILLSLIAMLKSETTQSQQFGVRQQTRMGNYNKQDGLKPQTGMLSDNKLDVDETTNNLYTENNSEITSKTTHTRAQGVCAENRSNKGKNWRCPGTDEQRKEFISYKASLMVRDAICTKEESECRALAWMNSHQEEAYLLWEGWLKTQNLPLMSKYVNWESHPAYEQILADIQESPVKFIHKGDYGLTRDERILFVNWVQQSNLV